MTTVTSCFQFDTVEVRPGAFEVLRDGKAVPLEPKSIRVLLHLLEHRERAVSKDELMHAVWHNVAVTDNALTRVIAQLRRELGDDARNPRYIQTVPTLGYRFVAEVRVVTSAAEAAVPAPEVVHPAPAAAPRSFPVYTAGLAVALLLAGTTWLVARRGPASAIEPAAKPASAIQVTTSAGLDLSPSFSPDGQSFVYSSDKNGTFEIFIRPVDTGARELQLTNDGGQNIQPVWSSDGTRIAWHSVKHRGIWVAPRDGSAAPRQVARSGSQPAWSPDSRFLAYRSDDVYSLSPHDLISSSKTSIQVIDAEGRGSPVTVASTGNVPGRQAFPTWTPDGSRILFSAARGSGGELWTVSRDGKAPRLLLQRDKYWFISPVFSPSGDRLYFGAVAQKSRDLGIWQQRLTPGGAPDGAPVELVRTGTTIPMYLSISRDGKRLAYTAIAASSHLWSIPLPEGAPRPLYQDNVFRASFPAFSPDGSRLAFFARLFGGVGDIWTINADGTGAAQMTASHAPEAMPEWTRDGLSIRYARITDNAVQLWERRVADGAEHPSTTPGRQVPGWPRVSPDGTRVAYHSLHFTSLGEAALNISVASLPDLSDTRQLTHETDGGAGFPAWSPDGKWIAYELLRGPHSYLAVMDANGNGQQQLNAEPGHSWVYGFSPDGTKLLFAGLREGTWNLWWLDRKTREQKRLTNYRSLQTFVRYPAWSPRGDQIVYELGSTRGNVFRLDLE